MRMRPLVNELSGAVADLEWSIATLERWTLPALSGTPGTFAAKRRLNQMKARAERLRERIRMLESGTASAGTEPNGVGPRGTIGDWPVGEGRQNEAAPAG